MRTSLAPLLALFILCPQVVEAAPKAQKVIEVPASGRWTELIPNGTVVAYERARAGKLTFRDRNGLEHYCTAQLTTAYDGTGTAPAQATLLLTAAHCARAGFSDFSFTSDDLSVTVVPVCVTRNSKWIDPDPISQVADPFINIRFDYAFLKLPASPSITTFYQIKWSGDWSDSSFKNEHILEANIDVIGVTEAGTLSKLSSGQVKMRPDFYHPKLNSLSTSDLSFRSGTSGGAWLNNVSPAQIISIISSMAKTSNTNVPPYATLYGPILHEDAHKLADYTEKATTVSLGECKP
jgi:hypothetical protein